jgi:hypothetical protein
MGVVVVPWLCWTTALGPLRGCGDLVGVVPVVVCVEVLVEVDVIGVVTVVVGVVAVVLVLGVVLTGASAGTLAAGAPGPVMVGAWIASAAGASTTPVPVSTAVKPPWRRTTRIEPFGALA